MFSQCPVKNNSSKSLFNKSLLLVASLVLFGTSLQSLADVKLPRLISDSMVIQRDQPIRIWGWADEGETVSASIGKETHSTLAKQGMWQLEFKSASANKVFDIDIQGKNHLQIKNVIAGDVWVAAGQSNMELPIRRVARNYPGLVESTQLPNVREFNVPTIYSFKGPQLDFPQGVWKAATPENLPGFSAVGFFFSRALFEKNNVAMGLITLPVGGSPAEAWVSEQGLEKYPNYLANYKKFTDETVLQQTIAQDKAKVDAWYAIAKASDLGSQAKTPWSAAEVDSKNWPTLIIPGAWKEQAIDFKNGIAWLKKNIVLSESQAAQAATLWLGCVVDGDEVFVNGQLVGQTGYRYPPRIYALKPGVLKAGDNNISIRLTSYSSDPGFVKDKLYALQLGTEKLDLSGEWKYQVGMRGDAFPQTTTLHYQPASLFNAKLAPVLKTNIKGVIWYQGESNTGRADEYTNLFADLIRDWRNQFHQPKLPFIFAQLPNFMEAKTEPSESDWAKTREAQRHALELKNTGMAVTIDLGEWNDIHPLNKQPVGERLALLAQSVAYNKHKLVASGPSIKSAKASHANVTLEFTNLGKGLALCSGNNLNYFSVAGADKKFVWAKATLRKDSVVLSNEAVTNPKFVRYAWADNPEGANLCNAEKLPASPFEVEVK